MMQHDLNFAQEAAARSISVGSGMMTKTHRFLHPGDITSPKTTLLLRIGLDQAEHNLQCGDLILVDTASYPRTSALDAFYAVVDATGRIALKRGGELGGDDQPVIGRMVTGLPGVKGLRYIPNLHCIGRESAQGRREKRRRFCF